MRCSSENCSSMPKLLYSLRCAACYTSDVLPQYVDIIRLTLKAILNVDLTDNIWSQATLPVSSGGLGVHLAVDLALPAFLSSVNGAVEVTIQLLPSRLHAMSSPSTPYMSRPAWSGRHIVIRHFRIQLTQAIRRLGIFLVSTGNERLSFQLHKAKQGLPVLLRLLLLILVISYMPYLVRQLVRDLLIRHFTSPYLLASESLYALHTHAFVVSPPTVLAFMVLHVTNRLGQLIWHNAVNDLITRALALTNVPVLLEPKSLCTDDGKRPDGFYVPPWVNGCCLVWDFTCPDTLAGSHLNRAMLSPSVVANDAEHR